jgi:hypothetical protein
VVGQYMPRIDESAGMQRGAGMQRDSPRVNDRSQGGARDHDVEERRPPAAAGVVRARDEHPMTTPTLTGPRTRVCMADLALGVGVAMRPGVGILPCSYGAECRFGHDWRTLSRSAVTEAVERNTGMALRVGSTREDLLRAVASTPLLR